MRKAAEIIGVLGLLIGVGWLGHRYFFRLDLTADKRYTLSSGTKKLLRQLPQAVYVTVYLAGDFPYPVERFRRAVETTLAELRLKAQNPLTMSLSIPPKILRFFSFSSRRGFSPFPQCAGFSDGDTPAVHLSHSHRPIRLSRYMGRPCERPCGSQWANRPLRGGAGCGVQVCGGSSANHYLWREADSSFFAGAWGVWSGAAGALSE
jgi:hypothetical protein